MILPRIYEPIHWNFFVRLPHIARLPLHEQQRHYRLHVCEIEQLNAIEACSGKSRRWSIENVGLLLQEDSFYVLQEDGSKIYVTDLVFKD